MYNLEELYQEVIIDHNQRPRNFGKLEYILPNTIEKYTFT